MMRNRSITWPVQLIVAIVIYSLLVACTVLWGQRYQPPHNIQLPVMQTSGRLDEIDARIMRISKSLMDMRDRSRDNGK